MAHACPRSDDSKYIASPSTSGGPVYADGANGAASSPDALAAESGPLEPSAGADQRALSAHADGAAIRTGVAKTRWSALAHVKVGAALLASVSGIAVLVRTRRGCRPPAVGGHDSFAALTAGLCGGRAG